jgi:TonB family protein
MGHGSLSGLAVAVLMAISARGHAEDTPASPPTNRGVTAPQLPPEMAEQKSSTVPAAATCDLWLWVRRSGAIQAAQIARSSGAPRLDEACVLGVINQTMKPGTVDGQPAEMWAPFRINWHFGPPPKAAPPSVDAGSATLPKLADQQVLNVDPPYYPDNALKAHKEGVCEMHVVVSAVGEVENMQMIRSTGMKDMDTACLDAVYAAQFIPAQRAGQNVAGAVDVWLAFRLPK